MISSRVATAEAPPAGKHRRTACLGRPEAGLPRVADGAVFGTEVRVAAAAAHAPTPDAPLRAAPASRTVLLVGRRPKAIAAPRAAEATITAWKAFDPFVLSSTVAVAACSQLPATSLRAASRRKRAARLPGPAGKTAAAAAGALHTARRVATSRTAVPEVEAVEARCHQATVAASEVGALAICRAASAKTRPVAAPRPVTIGRRVPTGCTAPRSAGLAA